MPFLQPSDASTQDLTVFTTKKFSTYSSKSIYIVFDVARGKT